MKSFRLCLSVALLTGVPCISLFAHSYGPPPRVTAAPGDNSRACTACHSSSALNSGSGSVKIQLLSGAFYIPGVKQRIAVQVSDPNQSRWGFEMTARLNSDLEKGQAGEFTPIDNFTQVICEDNAPRPCASGVTFITHTSVGTRNGTKNGATFQFDWTPPSTNAGPVTFYVAGNAANGNGSNSGDLIYTNSVQLSPAVPAAPQVTAGNVMNAAAPTAPAVSPNSWMTIYGSNLGVTTRGWADSDLERGALPFSLDGVSVLLNEFGAPRLAYVGYVSPTQVNFVMPSDYTPAATTVQVRNPAGISTAVPITVQASAGQLFTLDGKNALATHANGSYAGKPGLVSSIVTTPVVPGETITLFGTGLGAATPPLIPGQVPAVAVPLATTPQVTIGGLPATVSSSVVSAGAAGVYELAVQVPSTAPNGDLPVVVRIGTTDAVSVLINVQK